MADQLDLLGSVSNTSLASASAAQPSFPPSANLYGDAMSNIQDSASTKVDGAYKTISEVAEELDVPTHVLRFWESRFPQVKPQRMRGGRRYYRPQDVDVLKKIKTLLYSQGYTIKGAKKHVKDKLKVDMPVMQQAVAAAPAPRVEAAMPKKLPAELSSLLKELKDLKQTLATFA